MNKQPLIHKPSKSILLNGYVEEVLNAIPRSKKILVGGREVTAVAHGEAETLWMLERGYDVPTPMETYFDFPLVKGKFNFFNHQRISSGFMALHKRCFLLNEMGSGKSSSIIATCEYLMQTKQIKKVLIVSPLSTLECVWSSEIFHTLPHRTSVVLYGTAARRKSLLSEDVHYYILNYSGLTILKDELSKRPDIDMVVFDEAACLRTGDTNMYAAVKQILTPPDVRAILASGSIIPNGAEGAWALAKLVNPTAVPKYAGAWKRMVARQVSPFRWIPTPDAHILANKALQPAILFKKEDCIDLPPNTIQRRSCELSDEQKKLFREMKKEMALELESGVAINAINSADRLIKLMQIIAGSVKDPETGEYHDIPCPSRIKTVLEIIEEAEKKVLIACDFSGPLRMLTRELKKHKISVEFIDGSIPSKDRNDIFDRFQNSDSPQVLVCNTLTVAHGVTLTRASVVAHFFPIHSLERWLQFNARIDRPGQDTKTTTVLISGSTFEDGLYDKLMEKNVNLNNTLDLYNAVIATNV